MKKLIIALITLFIISGCSNPQQEKIHIISPSGAPALALIELIDDENVNIDIVDGSDVLQAEFINGNADIIIAPINLGVKLSKKTENYKLSTIVTAGNLYLVSTNKEVTINNKVAAFGESAVPGKIISYLKEELSSYEFEWFNSVSETTSAMLSGEYEAALLAEPYLTIAREKSRNEIFEIANIQDIYKEKTSLSFYPQAAIFVNTKAEENFDSLLARIEEGINKYNKDKEKLSKRIEEIDLNKLGFENKNLIIDAYQRMGLVFKKSKEEKEAITIFLKLFDEKFDDGILY